MWLLPYKYFAARIPDYRNKYLDIECMGKERFCELSFCVQPGQGGKKWILKAN
jgi:hypothetical protein